MSIVEHFQTVFRTQQSPTPRVQMAFCAIATGLPLFFGYFFGEIHVAIYGALIGYFLSVHSQSGPLRHRIGMTSLTVLMLFCGMSLGLFLQNRPLELYLVIGLGSYWVGVMGSQGTDLEKALLLSLFQVIVAAHSRFIDFGYLSRVVGYASIGYLFIIFATLVYFIAVKPPAVPYTRFIHALKAPLQSRAEIHIHALSYALLGVFAAWLMDYLQVPRGYWAVVTALLIVKPDRKESFLRISQRLIGTIFGVLTAFIILYFFQTQLALILFITLLSGLVPWGLSKNYGLVSFLISVIIVLLLELPIIEHRDMQLPWLRVSATFYGSLLALLGIFLSHFLMFILLPRLKKTS